MTCRNSSMATKSATNFTSKLDYGLWQLTSSSNLLIPSDASMRQWSRPSLLIAHSVPSHYMDQWILISDWVTDTISQWHLNQYTAICVKEFEHIVCKMAANLSRPQCVKNLRRFSNLLGTAYSLLIYLNDLFVNPSCKSELAAQRMIINMNKPVCYFGFM